MVRIALAGLSLDPGADGSRTRLRAHVSVLTTRARRSRYRDGPDHVDRSVGSLSVKNRLGKGERVWKKINLLIVLLNYFRACRTVFNSSRTTPYRPSCRLSGCDSAATQHSRPGVISGHGSPRAGPGGPVSVLVRLNMMGGATYCFICAQLASLLHLTVSSPALHAPTSVGLATPDATARYCRGRSRPPVVTVAGPPGP